mmetsp:Transcript_13337/g.37883  ORF Transcript_13337/g.37883 Transcript_13337/m.37883 type:complete len:334 (+) Transcript_13337:9-1010(+)
MKFFRGCSLTRLDFDGYDRNWPLAFSVSSLNCLGAGGQPSQSTRSIAQPTWSPVYFGIRVTFSVTMLTVLALSAVNDSGVRSERYLCNTNTTQSMSLSGCADALGIELGSICGQAQEARGESGDGVLWSVWECVCPGPIWLAYLTHQTLLIQNVYLLLAAYTTWMGKDYVKGAGPSGVPAGTPVGPWYVRAVWLLHSVQVAGTFLVFALFWGLVFDGTFSALVTPPTHGLNWAVSVLDWWLSKQPTYCIHVIWAFMFAFWYCLFLVAWWASGATTCHGDNYIYAALDLNQGAATWALMVGICLVAVPAAYGIFVAVIKTCRVVGGDVVPPSDD